MQSGGEQDVKKHAKKHPDITCIDLVAVDSPPNRDHPSPGGHVKGGTKRGGVVPRVIDEPRKRKHDKEAREISDRPRAKKPKRRDRSPSSESGESTSSAYTA